MGSPHPTTGFALYMIHSIVGTKRSGGEQGAVQNVDGGTLV
jgi:hypothetical protein